MDRLQKAKESILSTLNKESGIEIFSLDFVTDMGTALEIFEALKGEQEKFELTNEEMEKLLIDIMEEYKLLA